MMIIYDDHIYDENDNEHVDEFWKIDFVSELFGDLWDMFWHHDWCLRNYLDPLTINFLFRTK